MIDNELLFKLMWMPKLENEEDIRYISKARTSCIRAEMEHEADKNHEDKPCDVCEYKEQGEVPDGLIEYREIFCYNCGWSMAMKMSGIIAWTLSDEWKKPSDKPSKLEPISGEFDAR